MFEGLSQRIHSDESGFTLIELLVVILIIGILAAIALPSFLNQRAKAQDAEAKSMARTVQTTLETYYSDKQTYSGADATVLKQIEPALNDAYNFTGGGSGADSFDFSVVSKSNDGTRFGMAKNYPGWPAGVARYCAPPGVRSCKTPGPAAGYGSW